LTLRSNSCAKRSGSSRRRDPSRPTTGAAHHHAPCRLERAQLIAQSRSRRALQEYARDLREALQALPGRQVRWHLDVDPIEFA
jgi:primosomal protein N'